MKGAINSLFKKTRQSGLSPFSMQNPIDNATYPDLKKPLNKFSQLLIIYQRLSETDSFIKHGSIQNRLKYDKIGKSQFLK